jgi:signal transduction histidine kinase/CheY-like chemotaxis protein
MPENEVAAAVYAEQVRILFQQTPTVVAVNAVNAGLTAVVLAPVVPGARVPVWLALFAALLTARLVLWQRYRRADRSPRDARRWALRATILSGLGGALWGAGGAALLPDSPLQRIFLIFVMGGMCAGAVVVLVSHLPTLLAFLLSASLPMAARFLAERSTLDTSLAGMITVFAVALSIAGWTLNRSFAAALRLHFELDVANTRLRAEIAEHRATESALRQAQKLEAVGQLTGGIAHDFNNLLTAVIGNLEMAIKSAGENTRAAPLLRNALQAAERGASLTQRLLAFARKQQLHPKPVNVGALVAGIEDLLRRTLGPGIHLEIAAGPDRAPAQVDAHQLELAILNLAINGRDAMPAGGVLRIGIENRRTDGGAPPDLAPGTYIVVSVEDTGTGMDEATLERVFEPFFTTKGVGKGSGLGLPMVHGFAAQSGGAVHLRSKRGHGTAVEIWLPAAAIAPTGSDGAAAPVEPPALPSARVLVCDDDPDVRRFVTAFLRAQGCIVQEANGGEAALHLLDGGAAIDLLIVDYAMPEMTGTDLIDEARRRRPGLKALLITGHADRLRDGGGDAPLLPKPFRPAELAERIADLLPMSAARRFTSDDARHQG